MKLRLTIASFIIAGCLSVLPGDARAQVRGRVLDAATQMPVAGSLVWLDGTASHARTASDGAWAFTTLAPGAHCIRVTTPGYEDTRVCITLTAGATLTIDLPIELRPVTMAPIVVHGRRRATTLADSAATDSIRGGPVGRRLAVLGTRTAEQGGGQLGSLSRMAEPDPGGGGRPHALYVWGSSAERGRVMLDGASLSAPLHLGALLPPFDPHVVESADIHTGGISPRYDGGTSYIMDITTRTTAGRQRTWGEVDLLTSRAGFESPVNGRGRVLLSARRVNDEIIDGLLGPRFGYGYRDALARADVDAGAAGSLNVTIFGTDETVNIPRDLAEDRAEWHNRAVTLQWRDRAPDVRRSVAVSASRGVADLPLLSAAGGHMKATLDRYGVLAGQQWWRGDARWDAGAEVEYHRFGRRASAAEDPLTGEPGSFACTPALPCSTAGATFLSAFGGVQFNAAPRTALSAGARATWSADEGTVHLLPRAALTFIADSIHSITLAAGSFSQPYARDVRGAGPDSVDVVVAVARAAHVEIEVVRVSGGTQLRGNAHLRRHARVDPTGRALTLPGAELSLEHATPFGSVELAYSVNAGYRLDDSTRVRMQHLTSISLQGSWRSMTANVATAYGSGLPLTSIVLDKPQSRELVLQPASPDRAARGGPARDDFMRVDATLGAELRIGRGDRPLMLLPYVRIINALGQRESLFYYQDDGDLTRPPRSLARVPAVPVVGVRWQF